ncbi:branched-chain amino acid ABC transporter substrate-binding protein [Dongia deserti]|uniref:branched-chain amino acid ABC transporter substrate-binding protein n=1 Tax=Dongia deserti TaxID=2268030 RepID=UPI000E65420B|nr:branched-chain amino acid ABC transporter substrate-binding protein [Dongia deserti]
MIRLTRVSAIASIVLLSALSANADIVIAVAGPMTGDLASYGEQMQIGAETAARIINAAGGVLGQPIAIQAEDDACDPKQAVQVANRIVSRGIDLVHGHFCSGSTLPASDVYDESGSAIVTLSTNPAITDRGMERVFRITGRDDAQGGVAASDMIRRFGGKRFAVMDDKSIYGQGIAEEVVRALQAANQTIVFRGTINASESDYSAIVSRLKAAGAEIVYFGGYHAEAGMILRQAAQQGLPITLYGGDGIASSELAQIAGSAADGTYFTFSPDVRANPGAAAAVTAIRAAGFEPEGFTLYSYASIEVLAEGVRRAGTTEGEAVAKALRSKPIATVIGLVSFDDKGDNEQPGFVLYQWRDNEYALASQP